jgi:hypothetical protein
MTGMWPKRNRREWFARGTPPVFQLDRRVRPLANSETVLDRSSWINPPTRSGEFVGRAMWGRCLSDAIVAVLVSAGQAAAADLPQPMRKRSPPVDAYGWTGSDVFKSVIALYFSIGRRSLQYHLR